MDCGSLPHSAIIDISFIILLWREHMLQKSFVLDTPVKQAKFAVREDHTLAVKLQLGCGSRTLVFHDFIRKPGQRFYLFNSAPDCVQKYGFRR